MNLLYLTDILVKVTVKHYMIKSENILGAVFLLGLVFSMSFPYLAHADASVNGFFPKDFVRVASVKKEVKNNNDIRVLAAQLSAKLGNPLATKSEFSHNQDNNSVDTFSIPKEYPNITKD